MKKQASTNAVKLSAIKPLTVKLHAVKSSAAKKTENALFNALSSCLANSYMLYLKTQNYHWNVTGPSFHSLHTMFQAQYEDLALAIDSTAERIRALGFKAYGSFAQYSKITTIKEGNENFSSQEMVRDLLNSQAEIVKSFEKALAEAQKIKDEPTINLIVDRIEIHQKNAWMLSSSL
jgi:starvation-inducible DNA-binding protein